MTDGSVTHATFTLERVYGVAPSRVFAAWADPVAKARWFAAPDGKHDLDFRVGGKEVNRGGPEHGPGMTFESSYQDIVPDERIVYTSTLSVGDDLATVSFTTVEFVPEGTGTRLVLTEHDAFLDGHEKPEWRERGTGEWLDALEGELRRQGS
ncbi:SRPBCC family protein [Streptosporangium sp. NPDC000563]|uniref:SRPBCC family protein n=1 Tax=Streptosporangium sp. NPDC000563 TaxID=3154366 RepID=UPI0033262580